MSCGYFEVLKLSRLLILLWCRLTAITANLKGVLSYACTPASLDSDSESDASPETLTEETPSVTVTPTQSHGRGKARPRS
jgi:hypothetical protein